MAKVYMARCIVKKNGKSYKKGSVIKDLSPEEIKQGLAEHWLEAVGIDGGGNDEDLAEEKPNEPSRKKPGRPGKQNPDPAVPPREALLKEAVEAGITVTEKMTVEEIQRLIAEAKARG